MNTIGDQLQAEYCRIEEQLRHKHQTVFDALEQELLEKWVSYWKEQGFDVFKIKVSVTPRVEVSLVEDQERQEVEASGQLR